jgi:SAM-dependent methyltransferase
MGQTPEDLARRNFGERAAAYAASPVHASQQGLARFVELAAPQPRERALDVATGTGHTALALAPLLAEVVGIDLAPEMLAQARRLAEERGIGNARFQIGDAHRLEFEDGDFDLVTTRLAAHHFSDPRLALREMARVLGARGRLVIEDRSVPEDDEVDLAMDRLDRLHDASHVRNHRVSAWREMLAPDFEIELVESHFAHRPIGSLVDGVGEEGARRIRELLRAMGPRVRRQFDLREVDGVVHLNHWYVRIQARKRAPTSRGPRETRRGRAT